jgi:hypothetical protein
MGAVAAGALIVIGIGLMIRSIKFTDALKYGALFVGIAVILAELMKVLVNFWCSMSFCQHVLLLAAAVAFWVWRQNSQQSQK